MITKDEAMSLIDAPLDELCKAADEIREFSFAPAANNRQRAASVASLGAIYYAQGKTVTAAEHEPEYLRRPV